MAGYEAPAAVRPLEKMIKDFSYNDGLNIGQVFDDWLYFIIGNFNLKPEPQPWWKYTREQNLSFHNMFVEWVTAMAVQIDRKEWFDAFGELYEACIASSGRRSNSGQFFTPETICEIMTGTCGIKEKITGKKVLDPACGSGRTLLSFHAAYPGNFMFAEDIDKTCCMMTVANFLIHGVVGEVVWHDSLMPDTWNGGWHVNEFLNQPQSPYYGIPHMREIGKGESIIIHFWEERKKQIAIDGARILKKKEQPVTLEIPVPAGKPVQLTLWD